MQKGQKIMKTVSTGRRVSRGFLRRDRQPVSVTPMGARAHSGQRREQQQHQTPQKKTIFNIAPFRATVSSSEQITLFSLHPANALSATTPLLLLYHLPRSRGARHVTLVSAQTEITASPSSPPRPLSATQRPPCRRRGGHKRRRQQRQRGGKPAPKRSEFSRKLRRVRDQPQRWR